MSFINVYITFINIKFNEFIINRIYHSPLLKSSAAETSRTEHRLSDTLPLLGAPTGARAQLLNAHGNGAIRKNNGSAEQTRGRG